MKPILVCTAASEGYRPLAEITEKTKKNYALLHNYEFQSFKHHNLSRIPWERVAIWKAALPRCEWLFWTGCDVAITNPAIPLEGLLDPRADFIFTLDGCGLQSDSWIMRNCEETRAFLDRVMAWEGSVQNEQDAMSLELSGEKILENFMANFPPRQSNGAPCSLEAFPKYNKALNQSPVRCNILEQWTLNAYPMSEYGGTGKERWSWQPLDFCCHLPGKSLEERVKFFTEILK